MRRLFTFFMCLAAITVAKAETLDLNISSWGNLWNGTGTYTTDDNGYVIFTAVVDYEALGITNWSDDTWTGYTTVVLEVGDISFTGDSWVKLYVQTNVGDYEATATSDNVTLTVEIAETEIVRQVAVQGKSAGDVITIKNAYLGSAKSYTNCITITAESDVDSDGAYDIDEWGNILSSVFDGYSDDAKVTFNYYIDGTISDDNNSYVGWGVGSVSDISGTTTSSVSISAQQLGDNSVSCLLSDLKDLLAIEDQYSRYGIYWNVWGQSSLTDLAITTTRTSVVVCELDASTNDAIVNLSLDEAEVVSTTYYSLTGVASQEPTKGINIVRQLLSDGTYKTTKVLVK